MKPILVLFAALATVVCSAQTPSRTEEPKPPSQAPSRENLDGGYIHGVQGLYLTLRKNGTYSAGLGSCTGINGIADGSWRIVGEHITFSPTNETKQIKGLLRTADIVKDGHYWALVRPEDRKLVKSKGISFDTCLKNTAPLHPDI